MDSGSIIEKRMVSEKCVYVDAFNTDMVVNGMEAVRCHGGNQDDKRKSRFATVIKYSPGYTTLKRGGGRYPACGPGGICECGRRQKSRFEITPDEIWTAVLDCRYLDLIEVPDFPAKIKYIPTGTAFAIWLNSNDLEEVPSNLIDHIVNIAHVKLSSNRLTRIPMLNSSTLMSLELDDNRITSIPPRTFDGVPNLRRLNLALNAIRIVSANIMIPFLHRYLEPPAFKIVWEDATAKPELSGQLDSFKYYATFNTSNITKCRANHITGNLECCCGFSDGQKLFGVNECNKDATSASNFMCTAAECLPRKEACNAAESTAAAAADQAREAVAEEAAAQEEDERQRSASRAGTAAGGAVAGVLVIIAVIGVVVWKRRRAAEKQDEFVSSRAQAIVAEARDKVVAEFEHVFGSMRGTRMSAVAAAAEWLKMHRIESKQVVPVPATHSDADSASTVEHSFKGAGFTPSTTVGLPPGALLGTSRFGNTYCATLGDRNGKIKSQKKLRGPDAGVLPLVVAKECHAKSERITIQLFCAEVLLVGALKHPRILDVVGAVLNALPMIAVFEFMENGNLNAYLRSCRATAKNRTEVLHVQQLLVVGEQIASACEFLESKKVVHRALMTSNVLVGKDHTTVKLTGFGSLREVLRSEEYVRTTPLVVAHNSATASSASASAEGHDLDIRWMAEEAFTDNTFSIKTDVWAFGVLMWEVMTFARKPYGAFNPSEIASEVRAGRRLEPVHGCPEDLWSLLAASWDKDPTRRPTFASLHGVLRLLLLSGADELHAKIAAASRLTASDDSGRQWEVPMKGWKEQQANITATNVHSSTGTVGSTSTLKSDSRLFGKVFFQKEFGSSSGGGGSVAVGGGSGGGLAAPVAAASTATQRWRLGLVAGTPEAESALRDAFVLLQHFEHKNLLPLIGCAQQTSAGGFTLLFDLGSARHQTLAEVFHPAPVLDGDLDNHTRGNGNNEYLDIINEQIETTLTIRCVDTLTQMALAIEYLHANQQVHGRLSSKSFYNIARKVGDKAMVKLLVGRTTFARDVHDVGSAETHNSSRLESNHGSSVSHSPIPSNIRWLPHEDILRKGGDGSGADHNSCTTATDVYSFGVLVWELSNSQLHPHRYDHGRGNESSTGLPHALVYPTDELFQAELVGSGAVPLLGSMLPFPDESITALLGGIFTACTLDSALGRPSMNGVATLLLESGPEDRWEQDRTQFSKIEKLGEGAYNTSFCHAICTVSPPISTSFNNLSDVLSDVLSNVLFDVSSFR